MTRQEIRQTLLHQRKNLTAHVCRAAADKVAQEILTWPTFLTAQHLAFYMAVHNELDPALLLKSAWKKKKNCYLPVLHPLNHHELIFMPYKENDSLIKNRLNILEPKINLENQHMPWALDIVFVPLVAFDKKGNRLGMGGGFYDRTFAFLQSQKKNRPLLIGLAYEFQKVDQLKTETWDIPLHAVITEQGKYVYDDAIN